MADGVNTISNGLPGQLDLSHPAVMQEGKPSVLGIWPCYGRPNYVRTFSNCVTLKMTFMVKSQGGSHGELSFQILTLYFWQRNLIINKI